MTAEDFDVTVLRYLRAEPFEPFVMEMTDGREYEVGATGMSEVSANKLAVSFGGATLVTKGCEDIIDIWPAEVRTIRLASQRVAS